MNFIHKLESAWQRNNSLLCVGLDPDPGKFPAVLKDKPDAIFQFNKSIIDATHDLVCAYKPQIAYFAAHAAETQLLSTIGYIQTRYPHIPVVLDAKRGDIGSTAEQYAVEAFKRYRADAVTVNPYLGHDSVQPFTNYKDKGVIILCRTSNAGAQDIQDLQVDGQPLYEKLAHRISSEWNVYGNCLMVVGATWPEQLKRVRGIVGTMPLLIPGIGAQGGDVKAVVTTGKTSANTGLIISSSRSVLYASNSDDFADAARNVAMALRDEINLYR